MQATITITSVWQQLINREIDCELALKLLVNDRGILNLDLLDSEVRAIFFGGDRAGDAVRWLNV